MTDPRSEAAPTLSLRAIRKTFGRHVAVDAVDLDLGAEEFLTFLGPSGSGKTTTLMMIAGLQQPDSGEIVLAGRSVQRRPAYRRDIGMVFQHYALFPHMTVSRNIAFPLEMRGMRRTEIAATVGEALRLVGLAEFGDRLPRQLSGGQQQRVALARALVFGPSLLLMDEPLGALDKKLREQLQREIKRVHRERRTSCIYVTHDQEEALTMSDRVAVFNRGRIEQIGTPDELYEYPATRFVAEFIGEMNFLPGTVLGRDGDATIVDVMGSRMSVAATPTSCPAGARVDVAIRPERLRVDEFDGPGRLGGRIVDAIYLGNSRRLIIRLKNGQECALLQSAEAAEQQAFMSGTEIFVHWDRCRARMFD